MTRNHGRRVVATNSPPPKTIYANVMANRLKASLVSPANLLQTLPRPLLSRRRRAKVSPTIGIQMMDCLVPSPAQASVLSYRG
jgi:hypothetical protein